MSIVPKRLGVKFILSQPTTLQPAETVPIFQRWIQERAVPGMLIDVIDYKHVPDGPGIILIADEGDYAYDLSDGEIGLQYIRKRALPGELAAALAQAIKHAIIAARQLEAEVSDIAFDYANIKISFIDRQHYRNTAERCAAVASHVAACLGEIYGGEVRVEQRYADERELLCITAVVNDAVDADLILKRLRERDALPG